MGVIIPQVLTEDKVSGAQIVDGSLKFDSGKSQYLNRTLTTVGNRRTWTASFWFKKGKQGNWGGFLHAGDTDSVPGDFIYQYSDNTWYIQGHNGSGDEAIYQTTQLIRDIGWYHGVFVVDTTQATESERQKLYINGQRVTNFASTNGYSQNYQTEINNTTYDHRIGRTFQLGSGTNAYIDGQFTQYYFIDGQALTPSYFGYTDALTNTWRPKKYDTTAPTNNPNNNTTWSNNVSASSGGFGVGEEATKGFDGNTATKCKTDTNGASITITFSGVNVEKLLRIRTNYTNGANSSVTVNGTNYGAAATASDGAYKAINGFTGALTSIVLAADAGVNAAFSVIEVDGVILQDATTTNNRTWDSSVTFGTNGFYLPLDGNTPIGQDQSGNGNNWTPVNFGGSNTIEKATGALPILNTDGGGKVARVGVRTDSNYSSLTLALPLVGNANDVSNQINGGSSTKTMTVNGNAAASSAQSNFYGGSFAFDGIGDYITTPGSTDFQFGTGDFTIEFWAWVNSTQNGTNGGFINYGDYSGSNCWEIILTGTASSPMDLRIDMNGTDSVLAPQNVVINNTWQHHVLQRSSGTLKYFLDGVEVASTSHTVNYGAPSTNTLRVGGRNGLTNYDMTGYMSDVRIYKGLAKYTQNFIPASTDPDILPDTPSGVAYSSNVALVPSTDGGSVAFDGTNDYLEVADSVDFTFGSGDWTMECFVYPITPSSNSYQSLIHKYDGSGASGSSWFWSLYSYTDGSSSMNFYFYSGSSQYSYTAASKVVRQKAWNHVVVTRDGNTVRLYVNGIQDGTINVTGLTMNDSSTSVRFGTDGAGAYDMNGFISNARIIKGTCLYTGGTTFTPPSAPLTATETTKLLCCQSPSDNATAVGTMYKSTTLYTTKADIIANATVVANGGSLGGSDYFYYVPNGNEPIGGTIFSGNGSITNSDASNRWEWYWYNGSGWTETAGGYNNTDWTTFVFGDDTSTYKLLPSRDFYALGVFGTTEPGVHGGTAPSLGSQSILNAAVSPSGIARNGNASATNFNPFTVNINTVRGQESGYATLNPLANGNLTLSNGNLTYYRGTTDWEACLANFAMNNSGNGKWYFEVFCDTAATGDNSAILEVGIALPSFTAFNNYLGTDTNSWTYQNNNGASGQKGHNNSFSTYGVSAVTGDTLGISLDLSAGGSNGVLTFYKNGISMGYAYNNLDCTKTYFPAFSAYAAGKGTANFGQKPFKFPPPEGFQPLALANTPRPTIVRPDQYVGIVTYTGDDVNNRKITLNFKPDLFWAKSRSSTPYHTVNDSVRGVNAILQTNTTTGEQVNSNGYVTAFLSDGVTVTNGSDINSSSYGNYVGWAWKAGGSGGGLSFWKDDVGYATTTAAGLTDGTLALTGASVNTKSGFSIISWNTNSASQIETLSHGLGKTPSMIIVKNRDLSADWGIYHSSIPNATKQWLLFTTAGASDQSPTTVWSTSSTTVGIRQSSWSTLSGQKMIAYIWAEIPGFSKFGSYTGNGVSGDGPYIHLGFRPRFFMHKRTDAGDANQDWRIWDSERVKYNTVDTMLQPNDSAGDYTNSAVAVDFLSNGVKIRATDTTNNNASGGTYIYAAWAEAPSFNLYGAQSNAR